MNKDNLAQLESNSVNTLRVVLIIGVVLIHSSIPVPPPHVISNVSYDIVNIIVKIIGTFQVPAFFVLSGYYFFKKDNAIFNFKIYKDKMHKRLYTLVKPYFIWSIIALVCKYIVSITIYKQPFFHHWYDAFTYLFFFNGDIVFSFPINGPLWYVRDLFLVCLVSPLIFLLLKKTGNITVYFLLLFSLFIHVLNLPMSLFLKGVIWFSIGAYIAIKNKTLIEISAKTKWIYWVYPVCVIINIMLWDTFYESISSQLLALVGTIFIYRFIFDLNLKYNLYIEKNTSPFVMFLFCSHFIVDFIKPAISHIFNHQNLYTSISVNCISYFDAMHRMLFSTIQIHT